MNTHSLGKGAGSLRLTSNGVIPADPVAAEIVAVSCGACDLVGGSFPAAEAAYLLGIHNRVHHGYSVSAAA